MSSKKVWFVTGASKGLGLALIKKLLAEGHSIAATSRALPSLTQAVGDAAPDRFLPLQVDLGNEHLVAAALRQAHDTFGRIDVLVNNAGYGLGGALEELGIDAIRENFEVNLFATIQVIRKALPYLRAQRAGHIINISSVSGFAPSGGWSVYAATKFAVSGLSEVLAEDLRPLGIKVTSVSPGAFRTRFLSEESFATAETPIADYRHIREVNDRYIAMRNGKQPGDPEKAADALMQLAEHPEPPVHLFLGSDAWQRAHAKIDRLKEEMAQWKELTLSTDHEPEPNQA